MTFVLCPQSNHNINGDDFISDAEHEVHVRITFALRPRSNHNINGDDSIYDAEREFHYVGVWMKFAHQRGLWSSQFSKCSTNIPSEVRTTCNGRTWKL
ncbi:hypothetical protein TorRG33x02_236620 [Trema orientale]|uniref:Uncharacterized protein n=1 Tax=Trema orientale TaxID=63057 RepID=A0A2P5E0R2_TREOI|nr:hypothetical protein TorRG33x02_236620 [Trema orientale]